MILIPQIYLKNGKVAMLEGRTHPVFHDDPIATAQKIKDVGCKACFCVDLGIQPVGVSPNLSIIKKIHDEVGLSVYVGGGFKTAQAIDGFLGAGIELVVMGSTAYQQPNFLDEICKKFPGKIAIHIDVKGGHVTIPGYAAVTNKTAIDYAEQFTDKGVRYIFYSDVGNSGLMTNENLTNLTKFCNSANARIICTSEVSNLSDIEQIINLALARLDGLVLAKSLFEGRVDLHSAISMVNDLLFNRGDDSTIADI